MTNPRRVPRRRLGHDNWRKGYRGNSTEGSVRFAAKGCNWVDNDGHISDPRQDEHPAWIRAHGAPETFWLKRGDRFENHSWAELSKMKRKVGQQVYQLQDVIQALHDNAKRDLGTEWDVKDLQPVSDAVLLELMERFARHAEDAYGPDWRKHTNIKILTTWGEEYALRVCRAAHAAGIPTLLSVRGRYRFKRYLGHAEITYIRGSAVVHR